MDPPYKLSVVERVAQHLVYVFLIKMLGVEHPSAKVVLRISDVVEALTKMSGTKSKVLYAPVLSALVLSVFGERYYKVTAEAFRVCGEIVRVVRPNVAGVGFDYKPYIHPIYNAILTRLSNQDQDQVGVKECAISCMGLVISTFGDNLQAELPVGTTVVTRADRRVALGTRGRRGLPDGTELAYHMNGNGHVKKVIENIII
ncbi:hypothetical protein C5167_024388 [Papaver somniferum]|uniref:Uncharacterized protein n=1 Tax=Papaver somniferum TaxID=3469 RepID=A0A4Y7JSA3_PAPSO|nr:hypothetical protein C5167_024388 [Papaver somniferum]